MWAIIKKEFKSYYLSPIGYVVTGILIIVSSIYFFLTCIMMGEIDLNVLYLCMAQYGLIIAAPILTMRMFSEERKNGTEQLILTSPIGIAKVVFGKLIAALGVMLIVTLITFMYFIIVSYFGNPSLMVVLSSMLGFLLVSAAALSVGMFASSITENQIISAVITITFLLMSMFMQYFNPIFNYLSIISFYEKFALGIISLTDIAGLVSFSFVFIALTIIVMQRRKLVK